MTPSRIPARVRIPILVGGLVWIGVLLALTGPLASAKVRSDWTRVQAIPPGKQVVVRLYDDEAQRGARKITGRFASATTNSVTLQLPTGQSRILRRRAVRKVLTRRPFKRRWPGWVALVISATTLEIFRNYLDEGDWGGWRALQFHATTTGLVTGGFFLGSSNRGVYNVPPRHRIP